MKKGFFLLAVIIALTASACSTPRAAIVYPEPVVASASVVFVGSGMAYASARESAVKKAVAEGYTKILAEFVEQNGITGSVDVTLIVIK